MNANIFHNTQKNGNDNWTKTGSCEPTLIVTDFDLSLPVGYKFFWSNDSGTIN